ncbi:MAG TPA: VWA domain-containing protein [Pyrinomonadaceae bacterium]|jgi:VWFA-related protein
MKLRRGLIGLVGALVLCGAGGAARAQEAVAEDSVVRVRTRVVSLDALVKDKKTKQLVNDLKLENFEVLADGQPRPVTYFSREGDAGRKPLALVLVFDLERLGAGRFLRRTEILAAMADELAKLPPTDEVAVVVLDPGGVEGKREWLVRFTRNRAQVTAAMAVVPTLVGEGQGAAGPEDGNVPVSQTAEAGADVKQTNASGAQPAAASSDSNGKPPSAEEIKRTVAQAQADAAKAQPAAPQKSPDDQGRDAGRDAGKDAGKGAGKDAADADGEVIDEFTEKDGTVVRRIVGADGRIRIERKNKSGSVEVDMDDSDLAAATWEIDRAIARERPNSQAAIVYVTDGIAPMFYAQRDFIATRLLRSNTIFSALVVDMKTGFKLAMPVLKPLGNWVGLSIAGSAQHFAKQTGGEVVKVHRPSDYATGLAKIIGNLTARYSLGFTLAEGERDDGQMHPLEVRVNAADAKGKTRKLNITARKGYYMPKDETAQQAAPKPPAQ